MSNTNHNQTVCYWPDGYWITDREEAELLDSINGFGGEHAVMEVPEGEDVQQAVNVELSKRAA